MSNIEVIEKDGLNLTIETFSNVDEILKVNDSRIRNFGEARTNTDNAWAGASWDEAVNLLRYGWDTPIKKVTERINKVEKQGYARKMAQFNDVHGFAPIVPNALKGIPQSMMNMKLQAKKAKVINIVADLGVAWHVGTDEVIEYVIKLASKILQLEKSGFRVRLQFMKTFNNEYGKSYIMKMPLKNENQPLDLKRIMFALGHPAMFRRICFDWYERFPGAEYFNGHGYSLSIMKKNHRDIFDKMNDILISKNEYLVIFGDDLDEKFKKVR